MDIGAVMYHLAFGLGKSLTSSLPTLAAVYKEDGYELLRSWEGELCRSMKRLRFPD